jgi:hypothetical protein
MSLRSTVARRFCGDGEAGLVVGGAVVGGIVVIGAVVGGMVVAGGTVVIWIVAKAEIPLR